MLPRIHPMRLRLVRQPFDNPDYIFELKHDGFRAVVYLQNGECRLVSRNQRNLGFDALKRSLAKLPVQTAILDGEIIASIRRASVSSTSYSAEKGSRFCTPSTYCGSMARI